MKALSMLLGLAVLCLAGLVALPTPATAARIHQELQGVPEGAQHLRRLLTNDGGNNNNNGGNNNNKDNGGNLKRNVYSEELKKRGQDPKFQAKQQEALDKGKEVVAKVEDNKPLFKDNIQKPDSGYNYNFKKQVDNGKAKPEKEGPGPKPVKGDKVVQDKGEFDLGSIVVPQRPVKDLPDKGCGKYKDSNGGDRCSCSNANDERCGVQVSLSGFQRDFDGQGAVFLAASGP